MAIFKRASALEKAEVGRQDLGGNIYLHYFDDKETAVLVYVTPPFTCCKTPFYVSQNPLLHVIKPRLRNWTAVLARIKAKYIAKDLAVSIILRIFAFGK